MLKEVVIPDLGNSNPVDVIEILVKPGDKVDAETPLLMLESDKASMEVPAPFAGTVKELKVKVGQKVTQGTAVMMLEAAAAKADVAPEKTTKVESTKETKSEPANAVAPAPVKTQATTSTPKELDVLVPDLGTTNKVDVIEINVKVGDTVTVEQPLIMLEGEKASMEIPSPYAGVVTALLVKAGDKIATGAKIATIKTQATSAQSKAPIVETKAETPVAAYAAPTASVTTTSTPQSKELPSNTEVFAGPAIRRFARELGVDLAKVKGTGRKGRIQEEDVRAYVKSVMTQQGGASGSQGGFSLPSAPVVDFAKFGEIETQPLSRIKKISGTNLQRNWIVVPHVTQFDEADITELEEFRKSVNNDAQKTGIKVTPLVFIMKAAVAALKAHPTFNSSLDPTGEALIMKKYYHIGVAVDTPNGLVVPVIRDVDKKGIYDLSRELAEISEKARTKGLSTTDMQGSTFTISSLGGIGGTAFTPIVNLPDVAILGVSKSAIKPVYQDGQFVPRLMLPLSLSYDHRVIDGAAGARFTKYLSDMLSDVRKLLL
jgi:pyruvate dehydrogenase E2 component (dihydrolipoamide acetyltransferase)